MLDAAADRAHHLFVEYGQRRAAGIVIDDEADRVRSDIDDGDALEERFWFSRLAWHCERPF
jgi:hypothetical protein